MSPERKAFHELSLAAAFGSEACDGLASPRPWVESLAAYPDRRHYAFRCIDAIRFARRSFLENLPAVFRKH